MTNVYLFPRPFHRTIPEKPPSLVSSGISPNGTLFILVGDKLVESPDCWNAGFRVTSLIPPARTEAEEMPNSLELCEAATEYLVNLVLEREAVPRKLICAIEGSRDEGWYITALVNVADKEDALVFLEQLNKFWPEQLTIPSVSFVQAQLEALHIMGRAGLLHGQKSHTAA